MFGSRALSSSISIAPLVTFRVLFGLLMFAAIVRFSYNGWIHEQFIAPHYHFSFFPQVTVLPAWGMYLVFGLLLACSICITIGAFFRVAAVLFAVLFTYVELIDKTWYLNHYYLICLLAILLAFSPAHRSRSVDAERGWVKKTTQVPGIFQVAIRFQIMIVYFFAGIAKINSDWLLQAEPLHIWLHARTDIPIIGPLFKYDVTAFIFSWAGMIFDLSIGFFLNWKRTALVAWSIAAIFHMLTAILFPGIGLFPFVMILLTTIFLPLAWHERLWKVPPPKLINAQFSSALPKTAKMLFAIWFMVQLLFPLRHLLYNGQLFYNEEGYRFSWRVMLMEKAGQAFFVVHDPDTDRRWQIDPLDHLTKAQEKQMVTQPDMILQFAHYLKEVVRDTVPNAEVFCNAYVTVNGRSSHSFIDPELDLGKVEEGWHEKKWVYDQ